MTEFEIVFIVLMTVFCGLLLWLYLSLSDDYRDLNNTMFKFLSLNRELVSILREEAEEENDEELEEETQPDDEVFHKVKIEVTKDTGLKDYNPDPRYKYSEDTLELFRVCDEMAKSKGVPPEPQTAHPKIITCGKTYVWANVDTIQDCINLLSTDGKGTKQQVKQKLEELLK